MVCSALPGIFFYGSVYTFQISHQKELQEKPLPSTDRQAWALCQPSWSKIVSGNSVSLGRSRKSKAGHCLKSDRCFAVVTAALLLTV